MLSCLFCIFAALPIYPGAQAKPLPNVKDPGATRYQVQASVRQVAVWYAARLRAPPQLEKDHHAVRIKVVQKERVIKLGDSSHKIIVKGVVISGQAGGSCFFTLIDRALPAGAIKNGNPGMRLNFAPDAPVAKPSGGSNPNRYDPDPLKGRSVQGRSVGGSFP